MSLAQMLDSARLRRAGRVRERKEAKRRQAIASGTPVRESRGEAMEKVAAALFCRDFLNDLDALLLNRKATLCLVWKGKRGQLYLEGPGLEGGAEILMKARRDNRAALACFEGEIGRRIAVLLDQHEVTLMIGWNAGHLELQVINPKASTAHALCMISVKNAHAGRYFNELEAARGCPERN